MKDTVLFDLDGTLVNSLADLADSVNYTMEKLGYSKRTIEEVRSFVGNGAEMLIKRSLPDDCQNDFEKAMTIYKNHYNNNLCNKTKPYDGIYELICELNEKGYKTGIVTNKPQYAAKLIGKKLFNGNINAVVGADLSKRKNKPYSDGVDYCLELLNSKRKNAIYAGDSEVDIATAKNAEIYCVGVSWGFRERKALEGADAIADSADELRNIIFNISKLD